MQPTVSFLPHVPISLVQRRLLNKLLEAEGNVVTHDELVKLWPDSTTKSALEMAVFNLRKKLEPNGYQVVSHRGLGYSIAEKKRRRAKAN
jgi:DNA-binding winged helix-turn-helix (wHTH) protein